MQPCSWTPPVFSCSWRWDSGKDHLSCSDDHSAYLLNCATKKGGGYKTGFSKRSRGMNPPGCWTVVELNCLWINEICAYLGHWGSEWNSKEPLRDSSPNSDIKIPALTCLSMLSSFLPWSPVAFVWTTDEAHKRGLSVPVRSAGAMLALA